MIVVPIYRDQANAFIRKLHRKLRPTKSAIFYVAVAEGDVVHGVAVVGRPLARILDDGFAAEILRVCTDGTPNACSMLYGACRRAARALGYTTIITYTLPEEGGASLRAAGFHFDGESGQRAANWHSRPYRTAAPVGDDMFGGKWRWRA